MNFTKLTLEKSKLNIFRALALIVIGLILVLGRPKATPAARDFSSEPVKLEGFNPQELSENLLPQRIVIPDLKIDVPVARSKIINGYWEVFEDRAGWGEGSAIPGQVGNQVIFAHARDGLFKPLKDVKEGMKIYVFTKDRWFTYRVESVSEVSPDMAWLMSFGDSEKLTLYTCSGFSDQKRLVVVAKP